MKIADKIKAALALNPEINRNRAKLRALYYIHKHNPKTHHFFINGGYAFTHISLYQQSQYEPYGEIEIGNVIMTPLYQYGEISSELAVPLPCAKKSP